MTVEEACIVLGIKKENMDEEALKKAYHDAARLCHPDANPENSNAASKFAMIEEAYQVLQVHMRFVKLDRAAKERTVSSKYQKAYYSQAGKASASGGNSKTGEGNQKKEKDKWDYYNEADRKFRQQRQSEARRKMEEAMRRQREAEKRKREFEEAEKRRQEDLHRKEEAETVYFTGKVGGGSHAAAAAPDMTISVPDKKALTDRLKALWDGFLTNNIIFDVALIALVFCMMVLQISGNGALTSGFDGLRSFLMWSVSILLSRRFTIFSKRAAWSNRLTEGIIFLVVLELLIFVLKLLYI